MSILAFLPFSACTQMDPFHDHVDFIPAWFLARFISLMLIVVKSSLIPFPLPFSLRRLVRIFWQWSRRKKRAIIAGGFPSRLRPIRWAASKSWARSELISIDRGLILFHQIMFSVSINTIKHLETLFYTTIMQNSKIVKVIISSSIFQTET